MKLEQQVVSLELAKKMKELGFKQESLWYWWEDTDNIGSAYLEIDESQLNITQQPELLYDYKGVAKTSNHIISAYSVAELGEMLPAQVKNEKTRNVDCLSCTKNVYGKYIVRYHSSFSTPLVEIFADTEADARAKMLIYLKDNNLI